MVDDLAVGSTERHGPRGTGLDEDVFSAGDLDTVVLRLVKDDPFASISELKQQVRSSATFSGVGWWRVFGILREHGLLSRRSRFRFARGRGRSGGRRF